MATLNELYNQGKLIGRKAKLSHWENYHVVFECKLSNKYFAGVDIGGHAVNYSGNDISKWLIAEEPKPPEPKYLWDVREPDGTWRLYTTWMERREAKTYFADGFRISRISAVCPEGIEDE